MREPTARRIMMKWLKALRWEQWAIVAVSAAVLTMGLPWGLTNQRRMELLLGGRRITAEQANEMRALREAYYEKLDAAEAEAGRRLLRGERPTSSSAPLLDESRSGSDWLFTPEERLVAFRSFIVGSAAADEQKPFSALSRMKPSRLDFDPRIYIYGGTYLYPLGAILFGLQGSGLLHVTGDFVYYLEHPAN